MLSGEFFGFFCFLDILLQKVSSIKLASKDLNKEALKKAKSCRRKDFVR